MDTHTVADNENSIVVTFDFERRHKVFSTSDVVSLKKCRAQRAFDLVKLLTSGLILFPVNYENVNTAVWRDGGKIKTNC